MDFVGLLTIEEVRDELDELRVTGRTINEYILVYV